MFSLILVFVLLLASYVLLFYRKRFNYWKKKNVPYIEPSIPWGSGINPFNPSISTYQQLKFNYEELKSKGHKYGGIYSITRPIFVIVDRDLIKKILSKDFQYFPGHGFHIDETKNPLGGNLFALEGEKWRNLRVKLTPTFTSGKMKMMFGTLLDCGGPMIQHVNNLCEQGKALNVKEVTSCFTTDVVGSVGFGIECNSFGTKDSEFRKYGKKVFEPTPTAQLIQLLRSKLPSIVNKMLDMMIQDNVSIFFLNITRSVIEDRETNNYKRNDFLQLLLDLKQDAKGTNNGLTVEQMSAQSFMFFLAGFETSSTTMTFCLHELSYNRHIQDKVREEINATIQKYEGKLTYEGVMEMKYLNMVVEETLRKYTPAGAIDRFCSKDYKIEETGTVIEANTQVLISLLGLHRDPEYYPDPEKFDPERFSDENKSTRPSYSYIPFGEGPRICIGMRFGLMQAKAGLCLLLKNYIFSPHETTKYDVEFHPTSLVLSFKDTLMMNIRKINQ